MGQRNIDGFLNINKPEGITSAEVARVLKRELGVKKVGYIGTLDPIAEGVLPVGMGKATRLFPFLEKGDKVYEATLTLGASTDTQDRVGKTIDQADPSHVTKEMALEVMETFVGNIEQIPPMFSAKKIDGERLYDLARKGIEVERKPIKATISNLKLMGMDGPNIRFSVQVTTGAYVRTLCHDIGQKLGVYGHLSSLVRTRSGHFRVEDSVALDIFRSDNLEEAESRIISLKDGLSHMHTAVVIPHAVDRIQKGMTLGISDIITFDQADEGDFVRVVDKAGRLVCVGVKEGVPMAGFPFSAIKPKKVLV